MKRLLSVLTMAFIAVTILGCGGASTEIKPPTTTTELNEKQKQERDAQIKKSMERSGYGSKPAGQ